jgi:alanine racemase
VTLLSLSLRLTLNGDALVSNWRWLAAASGRAVCGAAVKADGYGLGAREVVRRLAVAGCRDFFVATWAEAEALGPLPVELGLSVFHGVREADMALALAGTARPVLNTAAGVARWKEQGGGRPCDVMVDTGMNRLGLSPEEARSGLLDGLAIDTLMSHLACADERDNPMNENQLFTFRALRGMVPARRYSLANSAGIGLGQRYAFGLTRPGLALYGGLPHGGEEEESRALKPVAAIEAQVLQVRVVPAGATIGYGATFTAPEEMRVAILNIGYADGYLRVFGGGAGWAWAGDTRCPVLGRVSMDLIAVGIGAARVTEGDWLRIDYDLAGQARATGLSQYELLTLLGRRYQRRWI